MRIAGWVGAPGGHWGGGGWLVERVRHTHIKSFCCFRYICNDNSNENIEGGAGVE